MRGKKEKSRIRINRMDSEGQLLWSSSFEEQPSEEVLKAMDEVALAARKLMDEDLSCA